LILMMNFVFSFWQSAVLGLVQGLTEFLPISSSGHLIVARSLFHFKDLGLAYDGFLHLGTLFAVLIYFRRDWITMFKALGSRSKQSRTLKFQRRFLIWLSVATLPAILAAYFAYPVLEEQLRSVLAVAIFMFLTGLTYFLVERFAAFRRSLPQSSFWDIFSIGIAQAAAIVPGISRSGATISAGFYRGLEPKTAVKISFLLAAPIILLAGIWSLWQGGVTGFLFNNWIDFAVGFGMAFLFGLLAIHLLLKILSRGRLSYFGYYMMLVGLGLMLYHFIF